MKLEDLLLLFNFNFLGFFFLFYFNPETRFSSPGTAVISERRALLLHFLLHVDPLVETKAAGTRQQRLMVRGGDAVGSKSGWRL